jgi:ribonuclease HI
MSQNALAQVSMFVDGSCLGNPGPGGWAAILQCGAHEKEVVGGTDRTTNNRMELTAVLAGLQALKRRCQVTVVTDSQYVATILSQGRAKANLDLVQPLRQLASQHEIIVQTVPGHSGHEMDECCDQLVQDEARRYQAKRESWAR